MKLSKGNIANLSAYSDEFNPAPTSADEPFANYIAIFSK